MVDSTVKRTRIFYDAEFRESGPDNPIDLISIGFVKESGEELYLVSKDFDAVAAWSDPWLAENVLPFLPYRKVDLDQPWSWVNAERTDDPAWMHRDEMVAALMVFAGPKPQWISYYADYDHVVLCQLFGRMIDLPPDYPMWTWDIKQEAARLGNPELPKHEGVAHNALEDARHHKAMYEFLKEYDG